MRTGPFGSHEADLQLPAPCPFTNPRDELQVEEGLSMREVDRLEVIREVLGRRLRQREVG